MKKKTENQANKTLRYIFYCACVMLLLFARNANAANYYWVGGTGNWNDFANHWATTSGGSTFHTQPPNFSDDVYFDASSFPSASAVVSITGSSGQEVCHDLNCSAITNNPGFNFQINLYVYGNLLLSPNMTIINSWFTFNNFVTINFDPAGHTIGPVEFYGLGLVNLLGDLTCSSVYFYRGGMITNNHTVDIVGSGDWQAYTNSPDNITFDLGTSVINCQGFFCHKLAASVSVTGSASVNARGSFVAQSGTFNRVNSASVSCWTCDFDSVTTCLFSSTGTVNNLNLNYNISVPYSLGIYGNSFISTAKINGNAQCIFSGNISIDSLITDSLTGIVIRAGDTLAVNNYFDLNNIQPSLFNLQSDSVAQPAFFNSPLSICTDSLKIKNIHSSGNTPFYAGAHSVDLGGNSGWQFTSCAAAAGSVWPGDANYDLTANNNDVLNIGIAYGDTGPVRSGASLAWVAQPATDWANAFANGANHKHADTNGDGIVDNNDTAAVTLNYGLTHPARNGADLSNSLVDPPLYLSALSDTLTEGDSVTVTISLGTAALPVANIYGLAFTINFDNTVLDTNYIAFDFTGSWLGTPGVDLLTYTKQRSTDGAIDVAITRTSHTDTSGFGYAGRFGSVIVDNVGARLASGNFMNADFTISNVTAIHFDETLLPLAAFGDSIVIDTAGTTGIITQEALAGKVIIYPNPASDKLMIRSGNLKVISLEIINSIGNRMLQQNNLVEGLAINTTVLSQGLYILKLQTEAGVVVKKFQVVKKKN